ncbi:hypothetical protein IG631_17337 [Alternaria alternata]|nr:hypothetical protein IG631_17337 [Alternaria alternata]
MLKWSCLLLKQLGCILLIVFKSTGEFSKGVMNLAEQAELIGNLILLFTFEGFKASGSMQPNIAGLGDICVIDNPYWKAGTSIAWPQISL